MCVYYNPRKGSLHNFSSKPDIWMKSKAFERYNPALSAKINMQKIPWTPIWP